MSRKCLAWVFLAAVAPAVAAQTLVRIKGSDTIGGALAPDLAAAYQKRNPKVTVTVEALGSGTAFVGLLDGSADIGASSRPASAKELEQAAARGVTLREYVLGYDGVAVIVHRTNPVSALTVAEVSDLFTGRVQRWRELGGEDRSVRRISRPSYSGTHAFFKEKALRRGDAKGPEEFAADTQMMEDNHDILAAVASDPAAVAYVGLGWVDDTVKALAVSVSRGQPAVHPSLETVRTGAYPLYRPLLLYTVGEPQGTIRDFLRFALSAEARPTIAAHGFVPADIPVQLGAVSESGPAGGAQGLSTFRIFFPSGGATLSPKARATLQEAADKLRAGGLRAIVVGHADALGPTAANQAVARARAAAAAAFLRDLGVPPTLLKVEQRGAEEPVASNETAAGRSANRRVDVILVPLRGE